MAAGSSPSPTGYFGFSGDIEFLPNIKIAAGATIFPGKAFIGLNYDLDLNRKFNLNLSCNFVNLWKYALIFEEDSPNERFYRHSSANFINGALRVGYALPKLKTDTNRVIVFVGLGYNERVSHYSIVAIGNSPYYQSDIDQLYKRLYRSGWYWNVCLYLNMSHSKRKRP